MIDANQRWELDRATAALEVLAEVSPAWIEEPVRAEDLWGHTELARRLAAQHSLVFRIDQSALGDSAQRGDGLSYEERAVVDAKEAEETFRYLHAMGELDGLEPATPPGGGGAP